MDIRDIGRRNRQVRLILLSIILVHVVVTVVIVIARN